MIKKTTTYTDFDGKERTEDFYFNLSEAELTEWEASKNGGMTGFITKVIAEQDITRIVELFKDLLSKAYGEKSLDGKRFIKNKDLWDTFSQTQAYSDIFVELINNVDAATAFVNGLFPAGLAKKVAAQNKTNPITIADNPQNKD